MLNRYKEIQERRSSAEGDEQGFTLIELLIVILVLGILAAIVIFALGGITGQSATASCQTDARSVQTAIAAWEANGNSAATTITQANLTPTYLASWPNNPGHYSVVLGGDTTAGEAGPTGSTVGQVYIVPTGGTASLYVTGQTSGGCAGLS
jgi:general secretion pathway protein G